MSVTQPTSIGILFACALALIPEPAVADEGRGHVLVPGFFGSLAAAPQQPGWSFTTIYYHTAVSAGADVAFARQVHPGNIQVNFPGNLNLTLKAPPDIQFFLPSYVFATKVLGGQASVALLGAYARNDVTVDGTLTGSHGGPTFPIGSA